MAEASVCVARDWLERLCRGPLGDLRHNLGPGLAVKLGAGTGASGLLLP